MVATDSEHKNCAYMWLDWIASPEAQAQVAEWFGEAPANLKACDFAAKGSATQYHADGRRTTPSKIWYWTTPIKQCLDGRTDVECTDYQALDGRLDRDQGLIAGVSQTGDGAGGRPAAATSRGSRRRLGLPAPPPGARAGGLVSAPLLWLGLIYLVALVALFVTAFWTVDFGTAVTRDWNLDNFKKLYQDDVYRTVILRTIWVAVAVTVIDAVLALPVAFYMAKLAGRPCAKLHGRRGADAAVGELPRQGVRLAVDGQARGVLESAIGWTPGFGLTAVIITLAYLWLPFMVLPIYAGFERCPTRCSRRRADLGAKPGRTLRASPSR